MIEIRPEHLTLGKLLDGRLFQVPDYQRAYSWSKRERQDLFSDIENVFNKGNSETHFMATIVCLRREKVRRGVDDYFQLDIVDGQQRLTTLILLLNAIKLNLKHDNSDLKGDLRNLTELLVKSGGDDLLLLQTNHDSSHHFADFLYHGTTLRPDQGETLADRALLEAIQDSLEFVNRWSSQKRNILHLYACVKNHLSFILHEISDEKLVYTVFEVLNSRGMEVAWLDRLKSILMGRAFELESANRKQLISDLRTIWRQIYATIGLRQGLNTETLRFAATLYRSSSPSRPLGEQDSVEEFRSKVTDAASIRDIARWLLRVAKACDLVIQNRRCNAVTRISQARLLAIAIHLRDDIKQTDRDKLLSRWEKVSFRIFGMMELDARVRVGDYVRLAWKIVQEQIDVQEIHAGIRSIGKGFPIEEAVGHLQNANCYEGWQDELRYFFFRYEEHLTRLAGNNFQNEQWERIWEVSPSKSIEHIFPQSTAPDDVKHLLGNLMILPPNLNSKLQDKVPKEKFSEYRKTGLLSAIEVASTLRWSKKAVREREKMLLHWASKEWAD